MDASEFSGAEEGGVEEGGVGISVEDGAEDEGVLGGVALEGLIVRPNVNGLIGARPKTRGSEARVANGLSRSLFSCVVTVKGSRRGGVLWNTNPGADANKIPAVDVGFPIFSI